MRPHPYLRAYMAGILVPNVFLLFAIIIFASARYAFDIKLPYERVMVFPMALVPNLWGAWNVLHLALQSRVRVPLGVHGAVLPLILMPLGLWLGRALNAFALPLTMAAAVAPVGMIAYYLLWKHFVGFLNDELGIGAHR
jgi:hypothetical protein